MPLIDILSPLKGHIINIASITFATAANNLMAFVIAILAARKLGLEDFGIFSLALALGNLVGVVGDLGFNLSMIRLFNKYSTASEKQAQVIAATFGFKTFMFGGMLFLSIPFGGILTRYLDLGIENRSLFISGFATGCLIFLWTFLQSYLQSYRQFRTLALFIWAYFGLRLLGLPFAYILFPESPLSWLAATYTFPLMLLIAVGLVPQGIRLVPLAFKRPRASLQALRELLAYGKWVALSVIAYTSMPHLLRFILAQRASLAEVGIFSAGMTFTVAFTTLNTAVRQVLFPQVTALEGRERMKGYISKLATIGPYYFVFAAVGVTALGSLQWFVLGEQYRTALPVFLITAGALSGVCFLGLGNMLVHTVMKPEIDAWTNLARLGLVTGLAFIIVPFFGAIGGAISYAIPLFIGEAWMFWYVQHQYVQ